MKAFTKLSLGLLFLALLFSSCGGKERETLVAKTFKERMDSLFATVPDLSGVVLIADKGKPVYHEAFGYLNFETKVRLDTASIFELASVSKQFTAMVIMMLKEEGKLSYDDLVEKFLPGLPYQQITIRQLLTHTSGLPNYQTIMDDHWEKSKIAGNADVLEYLKRYHPAKQFEPGEKYEYSNTGYVLLGSIAEKAAAKDFVEFSRDRIFKPLAMTRTDIRTLREKTMTDNFALGHIYVPEKQRYVRADSFPASNYTIWLGNRKGPGRISSTAYDLLKWDRALYTETLIKKSALQEAFTPTKLNNDSLSNYGFGWELETSRLGKVVRHSGDNPGYKTHIIRYVDADKTVILLCNNAHEKYGEVLKGIEELVE
jgi:CubicO group peptidase (beta-lactamase class C family)